MSEFKEVTIGDVCSVGDGAHSKVKRTDSGIPYLTSKNIGQGSLKLDKLDFISEESFEKLFSKDSKATRRPQPGDVLFGIIGTFGNAYLYKEQDHFGFSSSIGVLRPDPEKLDSEYLYCVVSSKQFKANHANHNAGSVQGYTNISTVKGLPIPLPPLEEQKRISKILKSLDDKIQLNRQTNQTLEHIAQAIFKSWFVDFDPTRAKIAAKENGQDPELAAMAAIAGKEVDELKALSADQIEKLKSTAALFPDRLVESELGEIPIGWRTENLNDEVDILNGFAFKSKDYSEKGIFVLRTKNFNGSNETERLHDDVFLPESFLISHEKYMAKPFDYHLIMVGASVGNRGIIYPCHLPALRNQNMWCFRAKGNSFVSQVYTKYLLDFLVAKSVGLASGSAREFFRKGDFGSQKICIGSEEIQAAFNKLVMPIFEKKASLVEENQILEALRDTLLPKLLSGELTTHANTAEQEASA